MESGTRTSPNTWAAAAYSLQSWFEFLAAWGGVAWQNASRDELIAYRDGYATAISPKTGSIYSSATIGNRMMVILAFHKYAGQRGWYAGDLLVEAAADGVTQRLPIDGITLVHARRGRRTVKAVSGLVPKRRQSRTSTRPFSISEIRTALPVAGPRATERTEVDRRPARDRLMFDFGWAVGLRLDEINQLTKLSFLGLHPDPDAPACEQPLIVIGKGRKTRTVAVPNWLVLDALAYIGGERKDCLKAGAITGRRESVALFLGGLDGGRPGRPISHRRMQQVLEEVCLRAGIVEIVERTDITTGAVRHMRKPKHCVHDLRHTYATLTYWAEKRAGNPEPWKKIQSQLGHEHLSTTIDTYLHFTTIFGEREGLTDLRKMIGL